MNEVVREQGKEMKGLYYTFRNRRKQATKSYKLGKTVFAKEPDGDEDHLKN